MRYSQIGFASNRPSKYEKTAQSPQQSHIFTFSAFANNKIENKSTLVFKRNHRPCRKKGCMMLKINTSSYLPSAYYTPHTLSHPLYP
jgi:hypothetical protein